MKPALTRNTTRATEVTLAFERNNTEQKRVVQPNAVHACYTQVNHIILFLLPLLEDGRIGKHSEGRKNLGFEFRFLNKPKKYSLGQHKISYEGK
jgi:hypothetical protein